MNCNRTHHTAFGVALAVVIAGIASAALPAAAGDDGIVGFRSPSGNIHCMFDEGYEGPPRIGPSMRCDVREIEGPPPERPRDCDLEWGRSFGINQTGVAGQLLCTGDAVFSDDYPVLEYGQFWQRAGFTCTSEASGITCFNAKRHGFALSRATRETF